jgi:hypothetical protein
MAQPTLYLPFPKNVGALEQASIATVGALALSPSQPISAAFDSLVPIPAPAFPLGVLCQLDCLVISLLFLGNDRELLIALMGGEVFASIAAKLGCRSPP